MEVAEKTCVRRKEMCGEMHQFQARKAVQPRQTSRVVALLHQLFKGLQGEALQTTTASDEREEWF